MQHRMYVFRLHRNGVIAVAVGALVLALLIFAGGWLVGVEHGVVLARSLAPPADTLARAQAVPLPLQPKLPAVPVAAPAAKPQPNAANVPAPSPAQLAPAAEATAAEAAPAEAPAAEASAAPAAAPLVPRAYSLQVAAFLVEDNAKAAVADLLDRGFEPQVVKDRGSLDRFLYRVLVGRYASRAEASAAARAFRREEQQDAIVVEARVPKTPPA